MSDALSQGIDFDYLRKEVIEVVQSPAGQRHRWLWLTKRPQRLAALSQLLDHPWPPNLWVGTSITTQKSTGRIPHLLTVGDENTIRFLSVEPQWESLSLAEWLPQLDWVIQGGESGPGAHEFHVEWAESLSEECTQAAVPYFLKQLGANVRHRGVSLKLRQSHGGDWCEWPKSLKLRQFPGLA
jgi:protein gp37